MLSGFVLSTRYEQTIWTNQNLKKYLIARMVRILPAYWIATSTAFGVIAIGLLMFGMDFFEIIAGRISIYMFALPDDISLACLASNALAHAFLIQTFLGTKLCGGAFLINPPLWSAAIEMWIYFLFPLVLRLVWKIGRHGTVCLSICILVLVDAIYVNVFINLADQSVWASVVWSVHFNPLVRLLELTLGVLLGRLWSLTGGFNPKQGGRMSMLCLFVFLICWGTFLFKTVGYTTSYWLSATVLPWAFIALTLMLYASTFFKNSRGGFASWCANISFIIYCTHWCLMELFALLGLKGTLISIWGPWPAILSCLAFVILLSQIIAKLERLLSRRLKSTLLDIFHAR